MNLDDYTYGKNPAEIGLARVLNDINNKTLTYHIGKKLEQVAIMTKAIAPIEHERVNIRAKQYDILKKFYYDEVDNNQLIKDNMKVESYFKNCIQIRLRALLRQ